MTGNQGDRFMETFIKKLKNIYDKRDVDGLKEHYDTLFGETNHPLIIGTSLGEIYHQKDKAFKMIESDLNHWGQLKITPNPVISIKGMVLTYEIYEATLSMKFDVTEATYQGFGEEMAMIDGQSIDAKAKAMEALYLLTHLLHNRREGERYYQLPVQLVLVRSKEQMPRLLAFMMPIAADAYDVLLGTDPHYETMNQMDQERFMAITADQSCPKPILDAITSRIREDHPEAEISFASSSIIHRQEGSDVYMAGRVEFKTPFNLDQAINEAFEEFHQDQKTPIKRRLFNLQKKLVYVMRIDAYADDKQTVVRCFGFGTVIEGHIVLSRVDLQYPHEVILENKNNMERVTEVSESIKDGL
jgi:hypothetical protein